MQIVHVEEIKPRVADYTDIPNELSENAKSALQTLGITKLYSHQVCMAVWGSYNVLLKVVNPSMD